LLFKAIPTLEVQTVTF